MTIAWCAMVLTCTQILAMAWLVMIVCTVLWMKPVTALAICGPNVVSSELIRVSPLLFSCVEAWLMTPVTLSLAGDLVGDLVGQDVLDRRVVDQRLHGGHVPAGVGHLVAGPYADHRYRSEHAAEHDQHDGDRGPPAEVPSPAPIGARLTVERRGLGAQPLQLSPLVLAELGIFRAESGIFPGRGG